MKRRQYLTLERWIGICKGVQDRRREGGNKRHDLVDILVIALLAVVCGCTTWEEIYDYGRSKYEWLKTFLILENGIPSEPTLRRVFSRIRTTSLETAYREWVKPYVGSCHGKQICIDGKTVCGAMKRRGVNLHILSAWVREDRITIGQRQTDVKSNEITAIPQLLKSLDISGGIASIDAMGCQSEIAAQIVSQNAHYLLAVKGSQPSAESRMWVYASAKHADTQIRCFDYRDSRSGECAKAFLEGFEGILISNGYSGYNKVPKVIRAGVLGACQTKMV